MLSDISYDKTEDDLDASRLRSGRKWKRPSAPPMEDMDERNGNTPPKRHRQVSQLDTRWTTTRYQSNIDRSVSWIHDGPQHATKAT